MSSLAPAANGHAERMDAIYRVQRHFYDVTRKYYLLGRDRLIADLKPLPGQRVLEVGCGTGRNLAAVARSYPQARLFGLDISSAMLESAATTMARAGAGERCLLMRADAVSFDPSSLFGEACFDRIFLSYTVSMIPDWQGAIENSLNALAPAGELHIVDFGNQAGLPHWFARMLAAWLSKFEVTPRAALFDYCEQAARARGMHNVSTRLCRGYASSVVISA